MEGEEIRRPDDLLETYAELLERWAAQTTGEILIRRRRGQVTERQFVLVYGLAAHTYETGHLLHGALARGPLTAAGFPLLRAMYESAVTAQWVAHVDDAAEALSNEYARNQGNVRDALSRSTVPAWRAVSADIPDADLPPTMTTSAAQGRYFERRCEDLQSSAELYAVYRIMSAWCHPGIRICDEYVLPAEAGGVVLRQRARAMSGTRAWGHMAAASLIWSARAVGYLAPDNEYRNYLRRVARGLSMNVELQPSEAAHRRAARSGRRRARPEAGRNSQDT